MVEQFTELKQRNADLSPSLLISTLRDAPEDDTNMAVLGEAAKEAGFDVEYAYMDEVEFSDSEGIFKQNPKNGRFEQFEFWFKLGPWEYIANEEPELTATLTNIVKSRKAIIINPAYTLLFQSKYILKLLWDLFPEHPLLLPTTSQPLTNKISVEKVLVGREGANIRILETNGTIISSANGEYGEYEGGKYGLVSIDNKMVIPATYDYLDAYTSGKAVLVCLGCQTASEPGMPMMPYGGKWGAFDQKGKIILII